MEASPVEGQPLPKKKLRKGEKGKMKKEIKNLKSQVDIVIFSPKSPNIDFCACPSINVVKRSASGKKGMLSCFKYIF